MPNRDRISVLPGDLLTAHGRHRYFAEGTDQTDTIIGSLLSGTDELFAVEVSYSSAFQAGLHSHDLGQATYILSGMITFFAEGRTFVVPAGHLIWLPRHTLHAAEASGDVHFVSLYENSGTPVELPAASQVIEASDLLKSVFERLIALQVRRQKGPVYDALVLLLFNEIGTSRPVEMSVPMPEDARLRRVCEDILRQPSATISKDRLTRVGNVSARTLSRLFKSELNLTFTDWLKQVLILSAISKLNQRGATVAGVAADLGYESPSAFTAMFRRSVGYPPSAFSARRETG